MRLRRTRPEIHQRVGRKSIRETRQGATQTIEFHRRGPSLRTRVLVIAAILSLFAAAILVPPGENPGAGTSSFDPETGEHVFTHTWSPPVLGAMVIGVASGYLLLISPLLAYKWPLGFLIPRRMRHRVHAWLGTALLVMALAHGAIFPFVGFYEGWLSGIFAIVLLAAHGSTGAFKTRLVRHWGAARWHSAHVTGAWAALLMTLLHSLGVSLLAAWMGYH